MEAFSKLRIGPWQWILQQANPELGKCFHSILALRQNFWWHSEWPLAVYNYAYLPFLLVPLIYIDAKNDDGIGGADIIYQKEIIKKIPEKSGCLKNATITSFVSCRSKYLKDFLEYSEVKCKVPAFDFTLFDTTYLKDCQTKESALEMDGLIYKLAQQVQGDKRCLHPCDLPKYKSELNFLSKLVLSKELKKYGEGKYSGTQFVVIKNYLS